MPPAPSTGGIRNSWGPLYLFVLISLPLFHAAHRLSHLAIDLGLAPTRRPLAIVCYATAIVGTSLAAVGAIAGL